MSEVNKDKSTKAVTKHFDNYLKLLLYGVIIVLLNVIGLLGLFSRCDITANGVNSISEASRDVVRSIAEPLTVKVFISKNLDQPYTDLAQSVEDILKEYKSAGNKYFSYETFDVGGSESETEKKILDNQKLAQDYGVYPQQIQTVKNDQVSFRKVYKGLAIVHGDAIQQIANIEKQQLEYTLTTTIKKMSDKISVLFGLKDKIKIELFLSSDLYAMGKGDIDKIPEKIKDQVDKLNKESYGKLEFRHLDSSKDPGIEKQAEAYNLFYIPQADPKTGNTKKLFVSLVVNHTDKIEKIEIIQQFMTPWGNSYQFADMDGIKDQLKDTVSSIIDVNEKIGYIADHGTIPLTVPDFMRQDPESQKKAGERLRALIAESYSIKEINLKNEEIPSGINCLVIAGPREQFSEWGLFQIDQFLMSGKSLAVFYDGLFEEQAQQQQQIYGYRMPPQYKPVDTGLEFLLEHYGVQVGNSYVFDDASYEQHDRQYGDLKLYYVPAIENENINSNLKYMRNLKGLLSIQSSPVKLVDANIKANNARADVLFSSSKKSWEVSDRISLDPFQPPQPVADTDKKSFPLAYMIEGDFASYYKGKSIPERPAKEKKEEITSGITSKDVSITQTFAEKSKGGKIFIIGTSEIARDMILEGVTTDKMFIANVLDYLNGRTDYAMMRSKLQLINPLDASKVKEPFIKEFTRYFQILGLPIITALFGIIVYFRRQGRKKMIQSMFARR